MAALQKEACAFSHHSRDSWLSLRWEEHAEAAVLSQSKAGQG